MYIDNRIHVHFHYVIKTTQFAYFSNIFAQCSSYVICSDDVTVGGEKCLPE
jgi:hypothetical protein